MSVAERNGEWVVASTAGAKRSAISVSTETRWAYGACSSVWTVVAPKASRSRARLLSAARA